MLLLILSRAMGDGRWAHHKCQTKHSCGKRTGVPILGINIRPLISGNLDSRASRRMERLCPSDCRRRPAVAAANASPGAPGVARRLIGPCRRTNGKNKLK